MSGIFKAVFTLLRRKSVTVTIHSDGDQVFATRSDRKDSYHFTWRDVDEIRTRKIDLVTTDSIRLAFRVSELWYEFGEEDAGFTQLAEMMRMKFPQIAENWFYAVMKPAFATNQTTLWKKN